MDAAAAVTLACLFAALAIRVNGRAVVVDRSGNETARTPRNVPRLRLPDAGWRWWSVVGGFLGWILGGPLTAGISSAGALVATSAVRRRREAARAALIDEQLADAVRSLSAGMRAGLSVPQAIGYAAREGAPPLAGSFGRVAAEVELGGTLDATLKDWGAGVGTEDARLVVGVLGLHRRTGGDLPRVLDQVAGTLRDRTAAAREVRALTAQARLSGAILGLLPIGFFGFLWLTSREQIVGAFSSPIGVGAVVLGLVLEGLAFLWIRALLEVA
jgi:tight adherence protein B